MRWDAVSSKMPLLGVSSDAENRVHCTLRQMGHFFSSKQSWTPETQPNDALRRRLVVFGIQLGLRETQ